MEVCITYKCVCVKDVFVKSTLFYCFIYAVWLDEIKSPCFFKMLGGGLLGEFLLVFFGIGSVIISSPAPDCGLGLPKSGLALVLIDLFGP